MRKFIISLIGVPEEDTQENREEIFKVIVTENPPDLIRVTSLKMAEWGLQISVLPLKQ